MENDTIGKSGSSEPKPRMRELLQRELIFMIAGPNPSTSMAFGSAITERAPRRRIVSSSLISETSTARRCSIWGAAPVKAVSIFPEGAHCNLPTIHPEWSRKHSSWPANGSNRRSHDERHGDRISRRHVRHRLCGKLASSSARPKDGPARNPPGAKPGGKACFWIRSGTIR